MLAYSAFRVNSDDSLVVYALLFFVLSRRQRRVNIVFLETSGCILHSIISAIIR